MPPTFRDEGLRAAIEVRRRIPNTPILKDRVADVRDFVVAVRQVANGGTVLDPEVVAQLVTRRRRDERLASLTQREQEVLALMAEGRTNNAIAEALFVSEGTVEKHVRGIFTKLRLEDAETVHRRVLAVLTFLRLGQDDAPRHG
jgi:DNA-binding NarL/FixJ family response regulator